jgi:hypothetical protein
LAASDDEHGLVPRLLDDLIKRRGARLKIANPRGYIRGVEFDDESLPKRLMPSSAELPRCRAAALAAGEQSRVKAG